MCYHGEFGRSALKSVGINTGNPRSLERWNSTVWKGGVADHKIHALPPSVTTSNFDISATKDARINRREAQNLGAMGPRPLAARALLTPYKYALPNVCYCTEFGRSRSNGTTVIKESRLKNLTPRVSHFKVTRDHRNTHSQ